MKMQTRGHGYWYENGYRVLYCGKKNGIKEHIKIMQDSIGRKIGKDEVVHHINHNKLDNRIENLLLMKRSDHMSMHRKNDGYGRRITTVVLEQIKNLKNLGKRQYEISDQLKISKPTMCRVFKYL